MDQVYDAHEIYHKLLKLVENILKDFFCIKMQLAKFKTIHTLIVIFTTIDSVSQ